MDDPKFIAEIGAKLLGITDRELFTKEMLWNIEPEIRAV
jgi:hypothetical protein